MDVSHVNIQLPQYAQSQPQPTLGNLEEDVLVNSLVKNIFFEDGSSFFMTLVRIFFNIFTLGLCSPLMANMLTRRRVRKMIIGNRRLQYAEGGDVKIAMWSVIDSLLNIFTVGLWYMLGFSHQYYLSQLDERISWGAPAKTIKKDHFRDPIVWEPSGETNFKIFSAYLGAGNEFLGMMISALNVIFLGTLSPFKMRFYYAQYVKKIELGCGRFTVIHPLMVEQIDDCIPINNLQVPQQQYNSPFPVWGYLPKHGHRTYELKLVFIPDVFDLCQFYIGFNCLMYITCGCFKCCSVSYVKRYLNKNVHVSVLPINT